MSEQQGKSLSAQARLSATARVAAVVLSGIGIAFQACEPAPEVPDASIDYGKGGQGGEIPSTEGTDAGPDKSVTGGAAGSPVAEAGVSPPFDVLPDTGCLAIPESSVVGACEKANCCDLLEACYSDPSCRTCVESPSTLCEGSAHWDRLQSCRELNECAAQLTLAIIHASANLPPFRVCFKLKNQGQWIDSPPLPSDPSAVMPHTNKIGIAPGGGLVLRHVEQFVGASAAEVTPYLIDLDPLNTTVHSSQKCEQLLDHCDLLGPCLEADEYHELPAVSLGVETNGISVSVLVVTGCEVPDKGTNDPVRCGSDGGTAGNLAMVALPTFKIEASPVKEGLVHLLSADLSPSAAPVYLADAGIDADLTLTYGELGDAGATLLRSSGFSPAAKVSPSEVEVPSTLASDLSKFASHGFTLLATGTTPVLQLSLAGVQDLSDNKSLPHTFWNASTDYLIAVIGDATGISKPLFADGGIDPLFDGYGLHLLALPLRRRPFSVDAGGEYPDAP